MYLIVARFVGIYRIPDTGILDIRIAILSTYPFWESTSPSFLASSFPPAVLLHSSDQKATVPTCCPDARSFKIGSLKMRFSVKPKPEEGLFRPHILNC